MSDTTLGKRFSACLDATSLNGVKVIVHNAALDMSRGQLRAETRYLRSLMVHSRPDMTQRRVPVWSRKALLDYASLVMFWLCHEHEQNASNRTTSDRSHPKITHAMQEE